MDKSKVSKDIDLLKNEVTNIIEDYKLSIIAGLDEVFKEYITLFCELK